MTSEDGSRRAYFAGVVLLAIARVRYRVLHGGTRQTLLSVVGVALAVGLLLSVTSIGLGLAAQGTVPASAADYWIRPEHQQGSAVIGVEGTGFSHVHSTASRLQQTDGVVAATPVLVDLVRVRTAGSNQTRRVYLIGIIPRENGGQVMGIPTDTLQSGDPYFANGSYDGSWTGQTVASANAAALLNVSQGNSVPVLSNHATTASSHTPTQNLTVVATHSAQMPGRTEVPVLVVHLAEAQRLTGAARSDQANLFYVETTNPAATHVLSDVYPDAVVVSQQDRIIHTLRMSELPLAMSLAAGLLALVVGTLTIIITMGFEIADDATSRAVLTALGIRRRTCLVLVVLETLVTTLAGGVFGVGLWLGIVAVLTVVGQFVTQIPLAVLRPALGVYGVGIALVVGVLSLPVLVAVTRRRSLTEALPAR